MTRRGLFITFEGGEGSGKTTQIKHLALDMRRCGDMVTVTGEPGATPLGRRLRDGAIYAPDIRTPDAMTDLWLYLADRREHVRTVVRPALERGRIVISDRHADSSVVYQGIVGGLGADRARELSLMATDGLEPDLTILLDVDPEIAAARMAGRCQDDPSQIIDRAPIDYHLQIRDAYLRVAAANPHRIVVIDGGGSKGAVAEAVWRAVYHRQRQPTLGELSAEVRDAARGISASLRRTPEVSWLMRLARRMVRLLLDVAGARR